MPTLRKVALLLLCLAAAGALAAGGLLYHQATHPASATPRTVIFQLKKGMTLKETANQLYEQDLILGPGAFRLLTYFVNKQNDLKAGDFELSPSMKPLELLDVITSGRAILRVVTIPEGYRITEIAARLAEQGIVEPEQFVKAAQERRLIEKWDIPTGSLEGYLFPETYRFAMDVNAASIVAAMLEAFRERVLKPEYLQRAHELGYTFYEMVTLASLVEKETGKKDERGLIASVFHNRLRKKMRLQCDPTVIYAIAGFDGNIHKKDLSIDSPYNTYRYAGLPPGPIASPGADSIRAALYPAETDYLYFVSRQDGSHEFTRNLEDHNRAVAKYQLHHRPAHAAKS